jgi:hypothetical protein
VVLGCVLLWFCTGRSVLLGEVAVKSGISIAPVLTGHTEKDESFAETRHNGQTQTKVCSQTKGVQSVDVISEERILGKFFRPRRERPSPGAESALVTKTGPPLGNTLCGEGR